MTIRKKLQLISILSILFLALMGTVTYFTNMNIDRAMAKQSERQQQLNLVAEMKFHTLSLVLVAMDIIVDKHEGEVTKERIHEIENNIAFIKKNVPVLTGYADTTKEKALSAEFGKRFEPFSLTISKGLVTAVIHQAGDETFAAFDDEIDGNGEILISTLETIHRSIQNELNEANASSRAMLENANRILIGGFLAFAVILLLIIQRVSASIILPMNQLGEVMHALSNNNVSIEVPGTDRRDELGGMANTVQIFKNALIENKRIASEREEQRKKSAQEKRDAMDALAQKFETEVNSIVRTVSQHSEALSSTSATLDNVVTTCDSNAQDASQDAEKTTMNIQMVAAATEEMSASVNEISSQLIKSTNLVDQSVKYIEGADVHAEALKSASNKVQEVVGIVADIAEKINLLALNATIESARAGEAGKGFAVVASEVKNLASQTNQSIQEIEKVISEMDAASGNIITTLSNIKLSTTQISESFNSISSALEEQSATTNEIANNMQLAVNGTESVMGKLRVVGGSTGQATSSAKDVSSAARTLSSQAQQLDSEIERFLRDIRVA